jgi:hypothetical protein
MGSNDGDLPLSKGPKNSIDSNKAAPLVERYDVAGSSKPDAEESEEGELEDGCLQGAGNMGKRKTEGYKWN